MESDSIGVNFSAVELKSLLNTVISSDLNNLVGTDLSDLEVLTVEGIESMVTAVGFPTSSAVAISCNGNLPNGTSALLPNIDSQSYPFFANCTLPSKSTEWATFDYCPRNRSTSCPDLALAMTDKVATSSAYAIKRSNSTSFKTEGCQDIASFLHDSHTSVNRRNDVTAHRSEERLNSLESLIEALERSCEPMMISENGAVKDENALSVDFDADCSTSAGPMPQQFSVDTADVLGFKLPLVAVADSTKSYVCVSDVFRTFFNRRHWDEFKEILAKNHIEPVSGLAHDFSGNLDHVNAITVEQCQRLLLNNEARKEGFVKCISLSNADVTSGSCRNSLVAETKLISALERQVGELVSGIKTRNQDQADIAYIEYEGQTLPSINMNGVLYVRLVDLRKKFINPFQNVVLNNHADALKTLCERLKIDVLKCPPNEKARLVVYANSCRSSSLWVIKASDAPRLVQEYKLRKQKKTKSHRRNSASGVHSADKKSSSAEDLHKSPSADAVEAKHGLDTERSLAFDIDASCNLDNTAVYSPAAISVGAASCSSSLSAETASNRSNSACGGESKSYVNIFDQITCSASAASSHSLAGKNRDSQSAKAARRRSLAESANRSRASSSVSNGSTAATGSSGKNAENLKNKNIPKTKTSKISAPGPPSVATAKNSFERILISADTAYPTMTSSSSSASSLSKKFRRDGSKRFGYGYGDASDDRVVTINLDAINMPDSSFKLNKKLNVRHRDKRAAIVGRTVSDQSPIISRTVTDQSRASVAAAAPISLDAGGSTGKTSFDDLFATKPVRRPSGRSVDDSTNPDSVGPSTPDPNSTPKPDLLINLLDDTNLAYDQSLSRDRLLDETTTSCVVFLSKSAPLPVAVYNRRFERGPAGYYYDHLFVEKESQCVYCLKCRSMVDLLTFVEHDHRAKSDGQDKDRRLSLRDPQLLMFVRDPLADRFDLWRNLCLKSKRYRALPSRYLGYNLPPKIAEYYEALRHNAVPSPEEQNTAADASDQPPVNERNAGDMDASTHSVESVNHEDRMEVDEKAENDARTMHEQPEEVRTAAILLSLSRRGDRSS